MPRPKRKRLDPKTQWIISDSTNQPVAPAFYHQELAKSVMRELSRDITGLELRREDAQSVDGSFVETVHILSREDRWLDTAQRDKRYFQGLCEGWLTCPKEDVPETAHSVQQ